MNTRTGVKVQVVRYVDSWQPGWIECQLVDIHGRCWSFIEKVPVIIATGTPFEETTEYPVPGIIACKVIRCADGIASIDSSEPWYIATVEEETKFEVSSELLTEW